MMPLDIDLPSLRAERYNRKENKATLRDDLNLLDEVREQASIQMADYQQRTVQYYNSKVKHKSFRVGDLIL